MSHPIHNCHCQAPTHDCQLIVVTGGPGAGKTAILEIARKNFCEHITILPEAAGIVFGGGFWRKDTVPARKAAQRAIYHIQRELEKLVTEERKAAIVLCDRGTLDGLAYWPKSEALFWEELATTSEMELARYSTVVHLRTPGPLDGYNLKNPFRIETPEQAQKIDEKILEAWNAHPRRYVIESSLDFLDKAKKAMGIIHNELPLCCRDHKIKEFGER